MLGNALDKIQESGCSLFFITSSVMSFLSGKKNRKASLENAEKDESFQRELQRQKERYDDAKEAKERAFRLWIKQKQRQWTAEETGEDWRMNSRRLICKCSSKIGLYRKLLLPLTGED